MIWMPLWAAIVLGAVQGLFMFLPVSSTAHLVLTQHAMIHHGIDLPPPEGAEMILFDLVVHVGTLVSIVIVFRTSLRRMALGILADLRTALVRRSLDRPGLHLRLAMLGAVSTAMTGILGFGLMRPLETVFANPLIVAGTLTATAILLFVSDRLPPRQRGLKGVGIGTAIAIGAAQAAALAPGLSRSGMTIVAALLCGLKRRWAAEYSFFLAIPTILAATLVYGARAISLGELGTIDWTALAVGFVVAAAIGTVALKVVVTLLLKAKLKIFSVYLVILAIVVAGGLIPL